MFTGLITAVSSAVLGAFWAILNYKNSNTQSYKDEKHRFDAYSDYLMRSAEKIKRLNDTIAEINVPDYYIGPEPVLVKVTAGETSVAEFENILKKGTVKVTGLSDSKLKKVTIPSSIKIDNQTFDVVSIGDTAFNKNTKITSVTIGSGVTSICGYAFEGCRSLRSIDIPSGVTNIGTGTFQHCSGLTSVTVEATTPPTLGNNAFYNTNNCPIYVPSGSVNAYKSASGWSSYASRIQPIT